VTSVTTSLLPVPFRRAVLSTHDEPAPGAPEWWLNALERRHKAEVEDLARYNAHYEGTQPLSYLAPELVLELADRLRQVVVAWPQLVVDSVEERLDVEGFRLGEEPEADEDLWALWQANDLDEGSQQAHLDALIMRRSYAIVGTNDERPSQPIITVESPLQVVHERNPRTRRVSGAAKFWTDGEGEGSRCATLYLPNQTSWWRYDGGRWVPDSDYPADDHGKGVVPVEPIVNRPRLRAALGSVDQAACGEGTSDLAPVIPLSDAACKIATDMMVAAEFHAMPRRWALGFSEDDFQDEHGNTLGAFSRVAGRIWATERTKQEGAEVGQFPEANLSGFHDTMKLLGQLVASVSGLPGHYLGLVTDNPASADAIRSGEARLVKRAERKQRSFGGSWERVMRTALLWRDGAVPDDAARMETIWRDAATPTVGQRADAAVKLFQGHVVPLRQTREDLGYSATQIDRMEDEDERMARLAFGELPPKRQPAEAAEEPDEPGDPEDSAPPAP
jgi:hypothetical protein